MFRPDKCQKGVIYNHTAIPSGWDDCLSLTKYFRLFMVIFHQNGHLEKIICKPVLYFCPNWLKLGLSITPLPYIGSLKGLNRVATQC